MIEESPIAMMMSTSGSLTQTYESFARAWIDIPNLHTRLLPKSVQFFIYTRMLCLPLWLNTVVYNAFLLDTTRLLNAYSHQIRAFPGFVVALSRFISLYLALSRLISPYLALYRDYLL